MKKFRILILFATIITSKIFSQEYNIYYSGLINGYINIIKEFDERLSITLELTDDSLNTYLNSSICPILPWYEDYSIYPSVKHIIVDGNTTTWIFSEDVWAKEVEDKDITIASFSDGSWFKVVIDNNRNIKTITNSDGSWIEVAESINKTIVTYSDGSWVERIVNENITTWTYSNDSWYKKVIDGNTTIWIYSDGRCYKEIIEKSGNNINITIESHY